MSEKKKILRFHALIVPCLLFIVLVNTGLFVQSPSVSAATVHMAQVKMQSGFTPHTVQIKPIMKKLGLVQNVRLKTPQVSSTAKVLFPCQSDSNPSPLECYGPGQIAQAYGVLALQQHGITGKGGTIVIVDPYGSPTMQTDLQAFDAAWGLPDPTLNVLTPSPVSGTDANWASETTLDVEWAHALAPDATIDLVVASSASDVDIFNTIQYAVDQNLGDVISMSFGENESCIDPTLLAAEHQVFQDAARKGISLVASSGDFGSAQLMCDGSSLTTAVSSPASDPLVTALGGTALTADPTSGQYIGETAWNETDNAQIQAASGGGYSVVNQRPNYQEGVTGNTVGRAVPDLALNASIEGGVLVYQTDPFSGQEYVSIAGGTSVAAPEFAGIVADGVQLAHHRLGFLNTGLYRLGKSGPGGFVFHDTTSGNNIFFEAGVAGYTVRCGWDAVTGWGTPNVSTLLPALIPYLSAGDSSGL